MRWLPRSRYETVGQVYLVFPLIPCARILNALFDRRESD